MVKDNRELRDTLVQLDEQLEATKAVDDRVRERLREAVGELQEALDGSDAQGGRAELQRSLRDRLSEAAQHFEGQHPALTAALSRVIDALSALGI